VLSKESELFVAVGLLVFWIYHECILFYLRLIDFEWILFNLQLIEFASSGIMKVEFPLFIPGIWMMDSQLSF
tara:strand:- start:59 stop:274 length:216 start_codon:yes stop_codon:yes gene_type:complete